MIDSSNISSEEALNLVQRIALKIYYTLPQGFVERDDLISEGYIGLILASKQYNGENGHPFEPYARLRIRGSIYDYLRKIDILPQKKRSEIKQFEKDLTSLEQSLERRATEEEILKHTGLTAEKYHEILGNQNLATFVYLDQTDYPLCDSSLIVAGEEQSSSEKTLLEKVAESIEVLTEKEQLVLDLFYFKDFNFSEIAQMLELSNARISQIHAKAIQKIKSNIN